jgi:DNA-binding Xre family transcriptional regulator
MAVSYKKLWKMLIDRDMKKKDLVELCDISKYTITRMNNGENISVETVAKICNALGCSFDDIMEIDVT